MRRFFLFGLALAAFGPLNILPHAAHAVEVSAVEDGKRKINLSGRQRMLTQRMAKAACFAAIGVRPEMHLTQLNTAFTLFESTLHGLRHGDAEVGINPEGSSRILREMDGVEELWTAYGRYVARARTDVNSAQDALSVIAVLNLPVLRQMNRTVGEFERHYGTSGKIHPALALTLNVAGRQRMLSQKASKEFCMILAGEDVPAHRAALAKTVALFDASLVALKDGNDDMGLPPVPTENIEAQLARVTRIWTPLKAIFDATTRGQRPNASEIERVAQDNNLLLKEMNNAVLLYAAL